MTLPDARPYWKRHYGITDQPVNAVAARRFLRAVAVALLVLTILTFTIAGPASML